LEAVAALQTSRDAAQDYSPGRKPPGKSGK
jgi:hypothetical protein